MLHRVSALACLILAANLFAAQEAPKPIAAPLVQEERSAEWLLAIEKIRAMPRPGDIQNSGILANIADIIETTPEQKAAVIAEMKAFDAEMVLKSAQWETEMKAARAEHEAKLIEALPADRRDAAKKALDYSHEQWHPPLDFEAKLRNDFLARKAKVEGKTTTPEELEAYRKDFMSWLQTQRQKARERNVEVMKTLKGILAPKEAERLNDFDKNKELPPQPPVLPKKK